MDRRKGAIKGGIDKRGTVKSGIDEMGVWLRVGKGGRAKGRKRGKG